MTNDSFLQPIQKQTLVIITQNSKSEIFWNYFYWWTTFVLTLKHDFLKVDFNLKTLKKFTKYFEQRLIVRTFHEAFLNFRNGSSLFFIFLSKNSENI